MNVGFAYVRSRNPERFMDRDVNAMIGSVRHMMESGVEITDCVNVESVFVMRTGLGNLVSTKKNVPSPPKQAKTSAEMPRV